MRSIITLDELEKELAPDLTTEDRKTIADTYRKAISIDDAAEMVKNIFEQISKQMESNPDVAAEFNAWSAADRMLFVAREMYTIGAVQATEATATAVAKTAIEILSESEIPCSVWKE